MRKALEYLISPRLILNGAVNHHLLDWLPDSLYLKMEYYCVMGKN